MDPTRADQTSPPASPDEAPIEEVWVTEREVWQDGPPYELFKRMRSERPVHWTPGITEYPKETRSATSP